MKQEYFKGLGITLALAFGWIWISGLTASPAYSYYRVKCDAGWELQTSSNPTRYRCRKRNGIRFIFKAGKCYVPTPYLTKHTHLGHNYSCGVQVGTTTVWNKFRCVGTGYRAVKNATSKSKTCRRPVTKYRYAKPTF